MAIVLLRRSPYCSRIRALLIESEGPDSGCFAFAILFHRMSSFRRQATCYSVISSIVWMEAAGYQFMVSLGDGLNS